MVIPNVAGMMSEACFRFTTGWTLNIDQGQGYLDYRTPCSCGQVYIGETRQRLEMRLKEHRDACQRGMMEKSAVAEHAWENHHHIHWEETTVLDHDRGQELLVKDALHMQMTP